MSAVRVDERPNILGGLEDWTRNRTPRDVCLGCRGAGWAYPITLRAGRAGRVLCANCRKSDLECGCAFQPVLFDDRARFDERDSIDMNFRKFHGKHPDVYDAVCHLARQAKRAGRDQIGIGMLWEVLRWQTFIAAGDEREPYKLNNNYRSRYARLVMDMEDDLGGFFETRQLQTP